MSADWAAPHDMPLQRLGGDGPLVSRIGLGCNNFGWRLDRGDSLRVLHEGLDAGITFFDTADVYGDGESERTLGDFIGNLRDRVVVATKFGAGAPRDGTSLPGGSPAYVRASLNRSLARLRTDYIDVYYYHYPDGRTPIAETIGAMADLVAEGKIRYIGCSNLSARELHEARLAASTTPLVALQNRYNLLEREAEEEMLPLCSRLGVGFVPYFPLARGWLSGRYGEGRHPPLDSRAAFVPPTQLSAPAAVLTVDAASTLDRLRQLAAHWGRPLVELALAGAAAQPAVASVIAGASTPEQVRANAAAAGWQLDRDERDALAAAIAAP